MGRWWHWWGKPILSSGKFVSAPPTGRSWCAPLVGRLCGPCCRPGLFSSGDTVGRDGPHGLEGQGCRIPADPSRQLPATCWFCFCLWSGFRGGLTPWSSAETRGFKAGSELRLAQSLGREQERGRRSLGICTMRCTLGRRRTKQFHGHLWRTWLPLNP